MKLPNGYESVTKLSGKRRKPFIVRKTIGYHLDEEKGKAIIDYKIIGYARTKSEGLQMLAEYNNNYPSSNKIKVLLNQLYEYAIKNDICNKDYATFVDIAQYANRNPNKHDRDKFTKEEISKVWKMKNNKYSQIILMLLYNGVRIGEFLDLKKENVHLKEQYFDIIDSKTENGIRKVPIADKLLHFYDSWYNSCPECEYLLHSSNGAKFTYSNFIDSYWKPLMGQLEIARTPHCTRHTTISMLTEAKVQETTIKKIVGHSGAMTLTEKVYTHLDISILIDAINKILEDIPIEDETLDTTA